jgi:hypothetical protein
MQELQSINVHMRIITEDNIDQIENMSFSNNIQKLTHNEHLDTKETIEQVQKDIRVLLRESKGQKFVIEDAEDSPEYHPAETPEFQPQTPEMPPPESPEFQPMTPDMPPPESPGESPEYMVGTPEFQPMTPPMSPVTAPENRPKGYFIDTPSDSEYSPPALPSATPPTKTYKGGDRVSYVKDSIPGRPWIVTPLNKPNLYKIESEGANQEVEIVTPLDIKPYETHIPMPGYGMSQDGHMPQTQIPSINIAPVFNMPGSTSMLEQSNANPSNTNEPVKIPTNEFTSNDTSFSTPEIPDITPKEDTSAKMDFNNIIIKKV